MCNPVASSKTKPTRLSEPSFSRVRDTEKTSTRWHDICLQPHDADLLACLQPLGARTRRPAERRKECLPASAGGCLFKAGRKKKSTSRRLKVLNADRTAER